MLAQKMRLGQRAGQINQIQKNHFEYISNFEWFDIWKNHHGQIIIKKISPFLIFISLIFYNFSII